MKDHHPSWRTGIERFGEGPKANLPGIEPLDRVNQLS